MGALVGLMLAVEAKLTDAQRESVASTVLREAQKTVREYQLLVLPHVVTLFREAKILRRQPDVVLEIARPLLVSSVRGQGGVESLLGTWHARLTHHPHDRAPRRPPRPLRRSLSPGPARQPVTRTRRCLALPSS